MSKLLTEAEMLETYIHHGEHFIFECKVDITRGPVKVKMFGSVSKYWLTKLLAADIATFTGMWAIQYYDRMPKFTGWNAIKFEYEFEVN